MAVSTSYTQVANSAWTELGAGPLALQAVEGDIWVAIAASEPSSTGEAFLLRPRDGRQDFYTISNLWAMSAALSGSGTVISAPVTA